ncbi:MAG TPA: hypothetical protein VFH88_08755 [Candidatus Krumholzibacteria bacterium]|nr:hypothetical protein [Candidatus Krumholzibacteria bacterium]
MRTWILAILLLTSCNITSPSSGQEKEVRISVDRSSYSMGDTIVVDVHNGLDSLLTTHDHQSFCSIARLDRATPVGWDDAGPCNSLAPTRQVSIASGESNSFRLPVVASPDAYPAVTQTGTYRWEFIYSVGPHFSFSRSAHVLSGTFVVQ